MTRQADQNNDATHQVIAFPARTPLVGGRQILFMFSVRQVVDVLRQVDLRPGTGAGHAVGLADWRGSMVPVLDLEKCLGLRVTGNSHGDGNQRLCPLEQAGSAARFSGSGFRGCQAHG